MKTTVSEMGCNRARGSFRFHRLWGGDHRVGPSSEVSGADFRNKLFECTVLQSASRQGSVAIIRAQIGGEELSSPFISHAEVPKSRNLDTVGIMSHGGLPNHPCCDLVTRF